jgi:hypothetical protein
LPAGGNNGYNGSMEKRKRRAASWTACKRAMATWPRAGVIALVHELYKLGGENRRFLHARLLEDLPGDYHIEEARRAIAKMTTPAAVYNGRFKHADLKRVVDQYAKASDDPVGVAMLLIGDLDASLATFAQVGDFEPIVDHVYASINRLHKCLESLEPERVRPLVEELAKVSSRWANQFGWGMSDELEGLAHEWMERTKIAAAPPPERPPGRARASDDWPES